MAKLLDKLFRVLVTGKVLWASFKASHCSDFASNHGRGLEAQRFTDYGRKKKADHFIALSTGEGTQVD
jgi:hypothetical protein